MLANSLVGFMNTAHIHDSKNNGFTHIQPHCLTKADSRNKRDSHVYGAKLS